MTRIIEFPTDLGQRYYETHYKFFLYLAKAAGIEIRLRLLKEDGRGFWFQYRGKRILIDFGDHHTIGENTGKYPIIFRYHYCWTKHSKIKNCYPLTPISFYDWKKFNFLKKIITYKASTYRILNNQKPGAAAETRRKDIQAKLRKEYGVRLDTKITDKENFWQKINKCLVSVCVPGARNDILDRGQFQYMAFGACTISPPLQILLPFWKQPEPGVHYIACSPDYSDLIEQIEWCRDNGAQCIETGQAAKQLFQETSTPERVWAWIDQCMEELK